MTCATIPTVISRLGIETPSPARRAAPARIPLSQLATISAHEPGASYIYRENNKRYIPIKFSVRGRDLASAINEAQRRVNDPRTGVLLPEAEGYRIEWSGEFAQMEEANQRLLWIVPISILLDHDPAVHGVQVDQGRLPRHPQRLDRDHGRSLEPETDRDAVFDLRGRRVRFDLRGRRSERRSANLVFQPDAGGGLSVNEAVIRGAELRLRPVVMTSLTAVLGLLPAALATSIGSQAQKPLGDRGRWRNAGEHATHPVSDAGALHIFPGTTEVWPGMPRS